MTIVGKAASPPAAGTSSSGRPETRRAASATEARSPSGNEPKIAFARWLHFHPGKKPSDFQPMIREAGFAYRCRAAFAPPCDDLGGSMVMERHLRNLELGLCGGWHALTHAEARALTDWMNAVLPHHPWGAALDWRQSDAEKTLAAYCAQGRSPSAGRDALQTIAAAGLADAFEQACSFSTWRDMQSLVLSGWLGGVRLVDDRGYLIADWKAAFAEVLATRAKSLH